jgi:hypothetical protein
MGSSAGRFAHFATWFALLAQLTTDYSDLHTPRGIPLIGAGEAPLTAVEAQSVSHTGAHLPLLRKLNHHVTHDLAIKVDPVVIRKRKRD